MKFTASRETLVKALTSLKQLARVNRTHPILGNVCLSAEGKVLTIYGGDLEKRKTVAIGCSAKKSGSTTIKLAPLLAYLSSRCEPDIEITLEVTENEATKSPQHFVTIRCGKSVNKMPGLPPEEMPPWPDEQNGKKITIAATLLNDCFDKALTQAATEDSRPFTKGVMMVSRDSKLNIQGTNGQRLVIFYTEVELEAKREEQWIIPRESAAAIGSMVASGDVEFNLGDNILFASGENCKFSTKLIEGIAPEFEKIFPKKEKLVSKITAPREALIADIVTAQTQLAGEPPHVIKVACDGEEITVSGHGKDVGDVITHLEAKSNSDKISFAVNPEFLKDALKAFDDEEITIHFQDAISPMVMRNDNCVCVVYPMRIS